MRDGTPIKAGLLRKYHVCRKCGSKNISKYGGNCYECGDCGHTACNPRLMYTVKEGKEQDVLNMYRMLVADNCASFSPYLARIIALGQKIEEGKAPETKDVKHVSVSAGGEVTIILAK